MSKDDHPLNRPLSFDRARKVSEPIDPASVRLLRNKLDLLAKRLNSLHAFDHLSLTEFIKQMPGFERVMPLLAQSVIDVCHTLAHRESDRPLHSAYDIIDSCEQMGILPAPLVASIGRELTLINHGFGSLDGVEIHEIQRGLPKAILVFHRFLDHMRTYLNNSA